MSFFPILPMETEGREDPFEFAPPVFYMEDFSILGIRVQSVAEAAKLFAENGLTCETGPDCAKLYMKRPRTLSVAAGILRENKLPFAIADVADRMYQG